MYIFIDLADFEQEIYYMGLPYIVESSFNQRFFNVLTKDEENIDLELEGKILYKFFKMKQINRKRSGGK